MKDKPEKTIDTEGTVHWMLYGLYHREDGPAIEYPCGQKLWYLNGLRHREDGPAVIYATGDTEWYFNGLWHRSDGPAVQYGRYRAWYLHGQRIKDLAVAVK